MIVVAAGGPNWVDAVTALGTVGAVVAAVGIALWTQHQARVQFVEERLRAREREQLNEAYRVQVVLGGRLGTSVGHNEYGDPGPAETKVLAVMVSNCGSYTITKIEAQICIGSSLIQPRRQERFASVANLPAELRGDYEPTQEFQMQGVLTQFDWGIRFESDEIGLFHNINPYAVVRWTDDWGTRWEHKRGVVRRVSDEEQWAP